MKTYAIYMLTMALTALITAHSQGKQIFVSPQGTDANSGSMDQPVWSVQKAQALASPGDTVYIRGGSYPMQESDISKVERNIFACISFLDKSGTEQQRINYWAYPGEQPVFDFSKVKPADQRVVGFYVTADYIHLKGIEMTGVQVTITAHTESYCVYSYGGNHNIYENLSMHDNKGTGLRHYKGGYNLFLNCDAYNNHDDVSQDQMGGNTDGFGCHPSEGGKGNVFRGCRAWFNSDDGFDCIRADEAVLFDSCWAFYNGYSQSFSSLGDGNGFKVGGFAYDEPAKLPDSIPSHTVQFCLAVRNKANGFYANHHLSGNSWLNNSAYENNYNYNMVNRESPESQNINVNGYDHVLKNNLGYNGRSGETRYIDPSQNTLQTNYFELDFNISDADFMALDQTQLTAARDAGGQLPEIDFMQIDPTSEIMDAGTDIGFFFLGEAPELGAFEQALPKEILSVENQYGSAGLTYPNPAANDLYVNNELNISSATLTGLTGRVHAISWYNNHIDLSQLGKGVYILNLTTDQGEWFTRKIMKH